MKISVKVFFIAMFIVGLILWLSWRVTNDETFYRWAAIFMGIALTNVIFVEAGLIKWGDILWMKRK